MMRNTRKKSLKKVLASSSKKLMKLANTRLMKAKSKEELISDHDIFTIDPLKARDFDDAL